MQNLTLLVTPENKHPLCGRFCQVPPSHWVLADSRFEIRSQLSDPMVQGKSPRGRMLLVQIWRETRHYHVAACRPPGLHRDRKLVKLVTKGGEIEVSFGGV
jgi:hypothetical protein